jgi:hypothetical protein
MSIKGRTTNMGIVAKLFDGQFIEGHLRRKVSLQRDH